MQDNSQPMNIEYYDAKTVVRKNKNSDNINLNPYQGCWHDCVYCDGKAENYHMHEDFGTRIRVKANAPRLLEKWLKKEGLIPINRERTGTLLDYTDGARQVAAIPDFTVCIGGGVCDVYQPAEKEVKVTRSLIQLAYDYNVPTFILTKNKLVLRDLDLLKLINESSKATVAMSIAFDSDEVQKIFEPNASPTSERFETLVALHKEGIHTGIWAMPLLPWIADTDENMDAIFMRAKKAGVEWMLADGLTLKPGRQKDQFMRVIGEYYPDLLPKYEKLYSNNNKWGIPDIPIAASLGMENTHEKGKRYAGKYGMEAKGWYGDGKW
ncbi:MAG: hypothetical protein KAS67_05395 [Thermoplasmata archaeon]|nr:hypothetical protein [Thermoplasmata archaeon]